MGNAIAKKYRGAVISSLTVIVIGAVLRFYKWNKKNDKEQKNNQQKISRFLRNRQEQIRKFKSQIDVENPTLQNVKQMFTILATHVRTQTVETSNKFKQQRRKRFPKGTRLQNMVQYFKFTSEGLHKLQNKIMDLQGEQTELISQVGFSQAQLAQYANQLGAFMQELVFGNDIPLQDLKRSIDIKTEYLQKNGEKIVDSLIELSAQLSLQDKQQVPLFMNVIISDEAFENEPDLDKEEFDIAYEKYRAEITPDLIKLEKVFFPLIGRLQSAFVGQQMGGNEMFGASNAFEQLGGMGDLGGMNEQRVMMQQMEQLRQSDPQVYEQLMFMMQAQMGR